MTSLKVLVADDDESSVEALAERLNNLRDSDIKTTPLAPVRFAEAITELASRQKDGFVEPGQHSTLFDEYDVVAVDNNLRRLVSNLHAKTSGDEVAYLIRVYSNCQYVIGLNDPPIRDFDLEYLPRLKRLSDITLSDKVLDIPCLWSDNVGKGFRPWHWPNIRQSIAAIKNCAQALEDSRHLRLIDFLGLAEVIHHLPSDSARFLEIGEPGASDSLNIERDTVDEYLADPARFGLEPKDEMDPQKIGILAATRLIKWLQNDLLPRQSILIDAPHLVSWYPGVMNPTDVDFSDLQTWNAVVSPDRATSNGIVDHPILRQNQYSRQDWLGRPVWLWPPLNTDPELETFRTVPGPNSSDVVFCEDLSQFVREEQAQRFRIALSTRYSVRYVVDRTTLSIEQPALGMTADEVEKLTKLEYLPTGAFDV